jgi:hypothetical protein
VKWVFFAPLRVLAELRSEAYRDFSDGFLGGVRYRMGVSMVAETPRSPNNVRRWHSG